MRTTVGLPRRATLMGRAGGTPSEQGSHRALTASSALRRTLAPRWPT
ncbi:hypothetical protein ACFFX0_01020 [Citricoccus parietis]|uniref:Uncharacterized protein n=1 Tax=Citricoccus parietis TaxID=592307 RepID=A0ABV5FUB2_9MICC